MPKKFDRCVKKLKKEGKVRNPYAVCKTSKSKRIGKDMTVKELEQLLKDMRKKGRKPFLKGGRGKVRIMFE